LITSGLFALSTFSPKLGNAEFEDFLLRPLSAVGFASLLVDGHQTAFHLSLPALKAGPSRMGNAMFPLLRTSFAL
jgi:hypothetical protein